VTVATRPLPQSLAPPSPTSHTASNVTAKDDVVAHLELAHGYLASGDGAYPPSVGHYCDFCSEWYA